MGAIRHAEAWMSPLAIAVNHSCRAFGLQQWTAVAWDLLPKSKIWTDAQQLRMQNYSWLELNRNIAASTVSFRPRAHSARVEKSPVRNLNSRFSRLGRARRSFRLTRSLHFGCADSALR
jgi:hypothetical protein